MTGISFPVSPRDFYRAVFRRRALPDMFPACGGAWRKSLCGAALELAGLAEAPQVGRHDRLDRLRHDADARQRPLLGDRLVRHDIVDTQQIDLAGRQCEWRRRELQE